jgi:hypothetical protein
MLLALTLVLLASPQPQFIGTFSCGMRNEGFPHNDWSQEWLETKRANKRSII